MNGPELIRILLLLDILAMSALAVFYLRRRPLPWLAFLAWGLLAVLVPVLGPFLVVACRPGSARRARLPRLRSLRLP